jgi:hypothetical protein
MLFATYPTAFENKDILSVESSERKHVALMPSGGDLVLHMVRSPRPFLA